MKIPVFLALAVAFSLGLALGAHRLWLELLLAASLGGLTLALLDRHFGYWIELRPIWRRDGEYLMSTLLAVVLAGYANTPFLKGLTHPWVGGLIASLGALLVAQAIELLVAWRRSATSRAS